LPAHAAQRIGNGDLDRLGQGGLSEDIQGSWPNLPVRKRSRSNKKIEPSSIRLIQAQAIHAIRSMGTAAPALARPTPN